MAGNCPALALPSLACACLGLQIRPNLALFSRGQLSSGEKYQNARGRPCGLERLSASTAGNFQIMVIHTFIFGNLPTVYSNVIHSPQSAQARAAGRACCSSPPLPAHHHRRGGWNRSGRAAPAALLHLPCRAPPTEQRRRVCGGHPSGAAARRPPTPHRPPPAGRAGSLLRNACREHVSPLREWDQDRTFRATWKHIHFLHQPWNMT